MALTAFFRLHTIAHCPYGAPIHYTVWIEQTGVRYTNLLGFWDKDEAEFEAFSRVRLDNPGQEIEWFADYTLTDFPRGRRI